MLFVTKEWQYRK